MALAPLGLLAACSSDSGASSTQVQDDFIVVDISVSEGEIWQINRSAQDQDRDRGKQQEVEPVEETQYLLVHRVDETPMIVAIGERQYRLLEAFANGLSLQAVIKEVSRDVDVLLPRLIANRWIVGARRGE